MEQAGRSRDYTALQLRRFRDENGGVVTVRERLEVAANGTSAPRFALTFLGVEGQPPGSRVERRWQATYSRYSTLFFKHGSFRIHDLGKAVGNYSLHDFGPVVRANRTARRMVVFPNNTDKAIWVVDVDAQTYVPLFVAEFDCHLRLFAEVEVVSFDPIAKLITPTVPAINITRVVDFAAGKTLMGSPAGLIDPIVTSASDYGLGRVEVHDDPLNGQQKLVMVYTDGIDEFMVVQLPGSQDPFLGMPSNSSPGGAPGSAHTIGRFRDPAMSVLIFWDDAVAFRVEGRGALTRLDDLAKRFYLQALTN